MNKIKGIIGIDTMTLMCLLVVILVGLSSFGLGRLSVSDDSSNKEIKLENKNINVVKGEIGKSIEVENSMKNTLGGIEKVEGIQKEKMYVASKNGKLYYSVSCSGAKRISEKNKVWFSSKEDAEKNGYTPSTSC